MDKSTIEYLKKTYPEKITKDQFYRICHISKKTASYLLDNGLVPCVNSGKKTRKYTILLSDVIAFLEARKENPLVFKAPDNYYKGDKVCYAHGINTERLMRHRSLLRTFLKMNIASYRDVLTPREVGEFTGYSFKTVNHWCVKEELKCFLIFNKFQIPKEYLLDFMVSDRCILIAKKSQKHIKMLTKAMEYINSQCASKK